MGGNNSPGWKHIHFGVWTDENEKRSDELSYALYPHMNVSDNIAYSLKMHHVPKKEREEQVQQAARMLGLQEYLQRKPKELSGGQRQRVALGRALVREPEVFLMDEPLSNLDAQLRVATRAEIIDLHQRIPTTTIYVTHDQVEAMTMGQRVAVLSGGLIQQFGTPQDLRPRASRTHRPASWPRLQLGKPRCIGRPDETGT